MTSEPGLRYAPGLDGVRALAVFAVVAYHIGTTSNAVVLPGGFLGVDIFFVLSGYLITSLLVTEAQRRGRISIKQFYIRRARRLLPALFALLLVVGAIGALWLPQQAARLRGDLIAALGYATNWWLIAENSSYFATAGDRPPLLTHLWSLAVEEQYYLVWPLVMIAFAAVRAKRGLMLLVVLAGVTTSTAIGVLLYDPFSDPSRVYYGTDTRALAPLLGAALAIAVQPWRHRRRLPRGIRHALDVFGIAALLALAVVAAVLHDTDEALYRGGFVVIALLAAIVVGVSGHPGTALGEMLGTQPLRWLGERSYAIYLWHWPVCLLTRPGEDVPVHGWANAALRIALAVLLAEISYHLIENPIRKHGFLAPFKTPRPTPRRAHGAAIPGQRAVGTAPVRPISVVPASAIPASGLPAGGLPVSAVPAGGVPASAMLASGVLASGVLASAPPIRPIRPVSAAHARAARARPRLARVRTVVLTITMVAGGTVVGLQLAAVPGTAVAGGPVDTGPEATLGPIGVVPTPSATDPAVAPPTSAPPLTKGAKVVFFGDSQGMTLLINKPADLGEYITTVDATIEGCGVLLGNVSSRSGERRNLTRNCRNWRSVWENRVGQYKPDLAVIMVGAWDVFDLTLDSGELTFGSAAWDANFTQAVVSGIDTLRAGGADVAISLLPCYRPLRKSAGFWPERGDDDRTRHVNDLLRAAAATYAAGVRTLDPPEEFCTKPSIASNTAYRWDGIHYYRKGAALYFTAILPQITRV
jgi:peptidoglycan/LPS O-acetylase OafA/YrhL